MCFSNLFNNRPESEYEMICAFWGECLDPFEWFDPFECFDPSEWFDPFQWFDSLRNKIRRTCQKVYFAVIYFVYIRKLIVIKDAGVAQLFSV